nr:PREDICTED: A-kinase anchor protein 14 isoform X2 [Latimeria chalumnae]|eukprot:XP_014348680.1 PREDICTED: A-kinase anchor protein 14 isoform X2 [Latimeria chalumnae]
MESTMDDECYTTGLRNTANIIVDTVFRNANNYFEELERAEEESSFYEIGNIEWVPCKDFTVEIGSQQIEEYISMWEFHESWLHCINFLSEEELEFIRRYHYRVRWSIPTCRKPIPSATASVYFFIDVSKIKPSTFPVEVFYTVESHRLQHRPGQSRFREKWLKDIIESKILLMETVLF